VRIVARNRQESPLEIPEELAEYIDRYALDEEVKEKLRQFVRDAAGTGLAITTDDVDARVDQIMAEKAAAEDTDTVTALSRLPGSLSNEQLREIDVSKIRELALGAGDADELGTGFRKVDDKRQLIDTSFLIVEYRFFEGIKSLFATVFLVTDDGRKLFITDGSTGIRAQLEEWTKQHSGNMTRMLCRNGLRMSEYRVCNNDSTVRGMGEEICPTCGETAAKTAATFYINENA
jgi:hypothetical protein